MKGHAAIVAILDGCGVEALKKAKMRFIDDIANRGSISFKCASVYPSATYTAHCSLITGKPPSVHEIVGNSFYDRSSGRVIDFDFHDVNEYVVGKTVFETINETTASIGEPIARGADLVVSKSEVQSVALHKQNRYVVEKAIEAINERTPRLVVMNFTAPDTLGEKYGPESRELLESLAEIDGLLAKLAGFLKERYEDHLLIVVADHGMTSVEENVELGELLKDLDPIVCPSHRVAHVYLKRKNSRKARKILDRDERFEIVLTREQTKRMNLFNPRTGDLVVFAEKGFELGKRKLKGSHGGVTAEEMNVPLIVNKPEYRDSMKVASITMVPSLLFRYLVEKDAETLVKRALRDVDPSHGWSHTERVLSTATKLALGHSADIEAVRLACILHDAEWGKAVKNHASRATKVATRFLVSKGLPKEKIQKIVRAIRLHHASPASLKALEEKILWDADKLDALGLVGLARCLQEAGRSGGSIGDAIAHLEKDTREFENRMHFKETRKIAEEKSLEVSGVIKSLKNELGLRS